MSETAPDWLNQEFFLDILKKIENDSNLTINTFEIKSGVDVGVNFASFLYKVAISFDSPKYKKVNESLQLMVKIEAEEGDRRAQFTKEVSVFKTEIEFYQRVLPAIERVLGSTGETVKLAPRLICAGFEPRPHLVFEDLATLGFSMKPDLVDLSDVKLVAKRIAQFHAASFYLSSVEKFDFSHFNNSMFVKNDSNDSNICKRYLIPGIRYCHKRFERLDSMECAKLAEGLKKLIDTIEESIYAVASNPNSTYRVLNHGDFSIRNMMFRQVDGVRDVTFIDYQIAFYNTPAIDLFMLLYTVAAPCIRREHSDEIIKFYHDEFKTCLTAIGFTGKIPTYLELRLELLRCGILEATFLLGVGTMQFINPADIDFAEMERTNDATQLNKSALKNSEYCEELMDLIRRLTQQGNI